MCEIKLLYSFLGDNFITLFNEWCWDKFFKCRLWNYTETYGIKQEGITYNDITITFVRSFNKKIFHIRILKSRLSQMKYERSIINSLCGPLTPAACRHVARWPLGFASLLVVFFLFFPRSGNRHRLEEQAGQFNLICKKQDCTEIKTRLKDA